jgi:hypothetical protein
MLILNYSHPLSDAMLAQAAALLAIPTERLVERRIATQIDRSQPLSSEVARLVTAAELTSEAFVLNPPGLAVVAAALVAEVHGRCGYFPTILAVAPVPGSTPPLFQVTEVLNLQAVRDEGRMRR